MPVTAADSGGHDLDHNTVRLGRWIVDVYQPRRRAEGFIENGFHFHSDEA
jgi:hypothetical protein